MAVMKILLPYSGVSVMLFHLALGSPLASSHHSLRKICQGISYKWEQETPYMHVYIYIDIHTHSHKHIYIIKLLTPWVQLNKTFEYSFWQV